MDRINLEVHCENNNLTTKINSICNASNENNKFHLSTGLNHSGSEANNEYNNIHSKLMIQDIFEKTKEFGYEKSLFDIKNKNRLILTQDSHSIIDKSITRIFPCERKSDAVIKNNLTSKKNKVHIKSFKLKPISKLVKSKCVSIQQELNRLHEKKPICIRPKKLISILPKPTVAIQTKPMQHNSMMVQTRNLTQANILIDFGKMEKFEKIFPVALHQSSDFQSIKLLDENIENKSEMFILGV